MLLAGIQNNLNIQYCQSISSEVLRMSNIALLPSSIHAYQPAFTQSAVHLTDTNAAVLQTPSAIMGVKVDPSSKMTGVAYSQPKVKAGLWGFMVLLGSFLCRILQDGYLFALAVFIVKWQEHFSAGAAEVGLVGSITTAFMLMICPMGSAVSRYYGCRPAVIGGGITAAIGLATASQATALWHLYTSMALVGVGMGIALVPSMVIIQFYFDNKLARVNGLAMSGVGVGMFTLSPLLHILCEHFGWKGALLISAALISNLCLCGALFRPSETEKEFQSRRKDSKEVKSQVDGYEFTTEIPRTNAAAVLDLLQCDLICNNGSFANFLIVSLLFGFGYYSAFLFLVAHAVDIGITEMDASFLLSIAGLCSLLGRLSHGFLIDLGLLSAASLYMISICLCGFCCLVYPMGNFYVCLAIFTAIFGFFSGIMNSLVPIVPKELVDANRVSGAVGLVCFMEGAGTLIGVYIMGALFDATGNYTYSFYSAGFALCLGAFLMVLEPIMRRICNKIRNREEEDPAWC